jgi:polyphosphate glucokinase
MVKQPPEMRLGDYERLLGHAIAGDATLFARQDVVAAAWAIVDPLLADPGEMFEYDLVRGAAPGRHARRRGRRLEHTSMKRILVIDVGGTNIKVGTAERAESLKIPSGKTMTAARMAADVCKAIEGWKYDAVSIGYPGAVKRGRPAHEPHNLSGGWMRFDYEKAFGTPVKIVNDAAMQALGAYAGGHMLFLGLGTGLGSALVAEGLLMPLELAHLPYRRGRTYEDYVGMRGFVRLGRKKWTRHVHEVVELLKAGLQADYVVLGGGQTKKLTTLPPGVRISDNLCAIRGGRRLWDAPADRRQRTVVRGSRTF